MDAISFTVKGTPKGQPRPRAFAKRIGNAITARIYDAGTAEAWKSEIAFHAGPHLPPAPLEGPIQLDVDLLFPRPGCLMRKKDPEGEIWHTARPDRDNCDKAVMDCLKTLGFFRDDAQVCAGEVRKFYIAKSGLPGARITITQLTEPRQPARDVPAPLFVTS